MNKTISKVSKTMQIFLKSCVTIATDFDFVIFWFRIHCRATKTDKKKFNLNLFMLKLIKERVFFKCFSKHSSLINGLFICPWTIFNNFYKNSQYLYENIVFFFFLFNFLHITKHPINNIQLSRAKIIYLVIK